MIATHLHILQHSLGVDKYGEGEQYRNRYVCGPECDSFADCRALVDAGHMRDHGPQSMCGGMHCFTVTPAGIDAMMFASPKPPVLTRAQKRYRAFLRADCGLSFGEWLRYYGKRVSS